MKKLMLAAAMLAPLAIAAPAFAQEASGTSGYVETPAVTTYAPNQPREFTARSVVGGQVSSGNQTLAQQQAVPSSAFGAFN
jgi:hypothetical protein